MTAFELKLVNGRLATSADVHPVDIGIREGKIAAMNLGQRLYDGGRVAEAVDTGHPVRAEDRIADPDLLHRLDDREANGPVWKVPHLWE